MKTKKKNNGQVVGLQEKIFNIIMCILGIIITIIALYPVYYFLIASISKPFYVDTGDIIYKPYGFCLESYKQIIGNQKIWIGYGNTIFYTVFGTTVSMVLSTTLAYALASKKLVGKKFLTLFTIFTMWFNAGMIPTYMNIKSLGLLNSRMAIVLGFGMSTYNMIILKSFFQQIPDSLEEAAYVDGANNIVIFSKIMLPLSKPALATVTVFYAINRWNSYFWPMIILKDDVKTPLQVILKKMIVDRTANAADAAIVTVDSLTSPTTLIYATIVIAIAPMLFVFPFVQKYFKRGLTLGGVKG